MEDFRPKSLKTILTGVILLLLPLLAYAQAEQTRENPPPVGQSLVREGTLAVRLQQAFGVGTTEGEVDAETRLGELGIIPRNGWIADYPVTPDILYELEQSIRTAADAGKLAMGRKQALDTFDSVTNEMGLTVRPASESDTYGTTPPGGENYPNPTVINNYYYTEGPPVVTYYSPPPDFYYLYSWVPFPFWCEGFWFPGFFVLHDFHRIIHVGGRVAFVSNHFNDVRIHRVYRVDPVARYRGRTYAGIGARGRRGFISTGIPKSERRIFNNPGTRPAGVGRYAPPARVTRTPMTPAPRAGRTLAPPTGGRVVTPVPRSRTAAPPATPRYRGGAVPAPRSEGMGVPRGGRIVAPPSGGGGAGGEAGGGFGGRRR